MFASIYSMQGGVSASASNIEATGGTVTTSGDYNIHTFNSSGTFSVTAITADDHVLDYLVIGGGGTGGIKTGGSTAPGGGGAGGYRHSWNSETSGGGTSSETGLTAAVQDYTVTIGAGGANSSNNERRWERGWDS